MAATADAVSCEPTASTGTRVPSPVAAPTDPIALLRTLGIQGVEGMDSPYERLKELTRGRRITGDDLREFVRGLGLPADVEARFVEMTPATYVGIAPQLVDFLEV